MSYMPAFFEAERVRWTSSFGATITTEYRNSKGVDREKRRQRYRPWISASSLLLFPCGVALVWLMVDSDKR